LLAESGRPRKPRISLSIDINSRDTLSLWWHPTSPRPGDVKESDFRVLPYLEEFKENRLVQVRNFCLVMVHHRRPLRTAAETWVNPRLTRERILADSLLL
jgi:hypothetical protein